MFCIGVLAACSTCLAWDDEDDESKPFHQSNYNQQSSANDYGYKNKYQANSTHRTSSIDFGGPKRLAQAEENGYSIKQPSQPQQAYEASRTRALHVDTIQESNDKKSLRNEELMAESQRRFEKQEADQERRRVQMAKQQEVYDELDREECEMAEFLGGVY